jgi:hypothetical protein
MTSEVKVTKPISQSILFILGILCTFYMLYKDLVGEMYTGFGDIGYFIIRVFYVIMFTWCFYYLIKDLVFKYVKICVVNNKLNCCNFIGSTKIINLSSIKYLCEYEAKNKYYFSLDPVGLDGYWIEKKKCNKSFIQEVSKYADETGTYEKVFIDE